MKTQLALAIVGVFSLGVFALGPAPAFAANSPQAMQTTPAPAAGTTQTRNTDAQARKIEQALPTLTRHEVMLQPTSLAAVTDEQWSKLHTYSKGNQVERLKVYPPAGSSKTGEFYYHGGKLVMVFQEPNGAAHEGYSPDAKGTRYYFNADGSFAINSGSQTVTTLDAKQQAMGKKLQRESSALLNLGSTPTGAK